MLLPLSKNLIMQSLIFIINGLYPILTIPLITSSLEIDIYGFHAISISIMGLLATFLDFGSTIKVTSIVSKEPDSRIAVKLIVLRTCILLILFTILLIVSFIVDFPILNYTVISFGWLFGLYVFPQWITNGKELMHIQAISLFLSRALIVAFIAVLYRLNTLTLNSLGLISSFGGIVYPITGLILLRKKLNFKNSLKISFKSIYSFEIYFSSILSALQRHTPLLLGSIFLPKNLVGIFAISDRIIKSFQSSQSIIGNTLFPIAVRSYSFNNSVISKKWFFFIFMYYFTIFLFCFFGGNLIMSFFVQNELQEMDIFIFKLFSGIILIGGVNYTVYNLILIPLGKEKIWRKSMVISTLFYPISLFVLVKILKLQGLVLATILFEFSIIFSLIYYLYCVPRRSNCYL